MWGDLEIDEATVFAQRLRLNLSRVEVAPTGTAIEIILTAISQDLNTPRALSALKAWCDGCDAGYVGGHPGELSRVLDDLLGLAF